MERRAFLGMSAAAIAAFGGGAALARAADTGFGRRGGEARRTARDGLCLSRRRQAICRDVARRNWLRAAMLGSPIRGTRPSVHRRPQAVSPRPHLRVIPEAMLRPTTAQA